MSSHVDLPMGRVEYVTPYHHNSVRPEGIGHFWGATIMDHIVSFAKAVREGASSEYTDDDAVMAMMMEVATRQSAQQGGVKIEMPISGAVEADEHILAAQRKEYGVDPLDVEAMLAISYPKP